MFPQLSDILASSAAAGRQGIGILLCDKQTDGGFLLHHFLSFYLKGGCKVCFLGLQQSFNHYNLVAQKLGVNLSAAKEKGQLVFFEGLRSALDVLLDDKPDGTLQGSSPLQFLSSPSTSLRSLYEFVCTSLSDANETTWKFPVLIIDDLSVLLSLGVTTENILDFMHYCRATLCSKLQGNIVVLVHDTDDLGDEENDLMVKSLCYVSHLILNAEALPTGYCKDIHGQLKITERTLSPAKAEKNITNIFQYKIQDKNVSFFARGTSSAVL
ncbi:elongator complex protein 6 [Rhinoraja longicauda]